MDGFVNSQTWEAWFESLEVLWDNTSYIFVISVAVALMVAVATWLMPFGAQEERDTASKSEVDEDIGAADATDENKDIGRKLLEEKLRLADMRNAERRALEQSMETQMTLEQREAEREAQSQQLAAIFKMMQEQEEKFGKTSLDDIKDQMKLYCG